MLFYMVHELWNKVDGSVFTSASLPSVHLSAMAGEPKPLSCLYSWTCCLCHVHMVSSPAPFCPPLAPVRTIKGGVLRMGRRFARLQRGISSGAQTRLFALARIYQQASPLMGRRAFRHMAIPLSLPLKRSCPSLLSIRSMSTQLILSFISARLPDRTTRLGPWQTTPHRGTALFRFPAVPK